MKVNQIKIVLFGVLLAVLSSCTKLVTASDENRAPVLVKAVTDISVKMNGSIQLSLKYVEAYDEDGDALELVLDTGINYALNGRVVVPAEDFIGDLYIPIRVYDGKEYSVQKIMIVSVVQNVELFPLIRGSWWEYRDSVVANDSVFTSRLEATFSRDSLIGTRLAHIYELEWENLEEYGVKYEAYTDSLGMVFLGGKSRSDSIVNPQIRYRYPLTLGESWSYSTLNYNATDSAFYLGEEAVLTYTDTLQYVSVPAGIFECVEITLTYQNKGETSESDVQSWAKGNVVEKLYYSAGVGYVKNVSTVEGEVIWLKELTGYSVEEVKDVK